MTSCNHSDPSVMNDSDDESKSQATNASSKRRRTEAASLIEAQALQSVEPQMEVGHSDEDDGFNLDSDEEEVEVLSGPTITVLSAKDVALCTMSANDAETMRVSLVVNLPAASRLEIASDGNGHTGRMILTGPTDEVLDFLNDVVKNKIVISGQTVQWFSRNTINREAPHYADPRKFQHGTCLFITRCVQS